MNEYSIYCTPEQTKKALELGTPIICAPHGRSNPNGFYRKYYGEVGKSNYIDYQCPTAEQMIGWLEEQGIVIIFMATMKEDLSGYTWIAHICHFEDKSVWVDAKNLSRKEATLKAINAALDYLINNNN